MNESRAGWRCFICDNCDQQWRESTRDRHSPSGVDCGFCGDWCTPRFSSTLPKVETDKSGNLLKYDTVVTRKGTDQPGLLPCPFCDQDAEYDYHPFKKVYSIRCDSGCSVEICTAQFETRAEAAKAWNTRCFGGHVVTLFTEEPGVISEGPCWLSLSEGYMYGPHDTWQEVVSDIVNEWKWDKNLVM